MQLNEVKRIGMLGGGVMGGGIGQVLALGGYEVVICDLTDEILAATSDAAFESRWGIKRAVEIGKLEFDRAADAMQRISFTTRTSDLANCDFVIEAVPERLELKQEVFKDLDAIVKPGAIFTSPRVIGALTDPPSCLRVPWMARPRANTGKPISSSRSASRTHPSITRPPSFRVTQAVAMISPKYPPS